MYNNEWMTDWPIINIFNIRWSVEKSFSQMNDTFRHLFFGCFFQHFVFWTCGILDKISSSTKFPDLPGIFNCFQYKKKMVLLMVGKWNINANYLEMKFKKCLTMEWMAFFSFSLSLYFYHNKNLIILIANQYIWIAFFS